MSLYIYIHRTRLFIAHREQGENEAQDVIHRWLAIRVKYVKWRENNFTNKPHFASVSRAFKQVTAAGRASPVPTVSPYPLMWGSVASPRTQLCAMCKCIPILVQCVNASLYFNEFVLAWFPGSARQMDKKLGNKKGKRCAFTALGEVPVHSPAPHLCSPTLTG